MCECVLVCVCVKQCLHVCVRVRMYVSYDFSFAYPSYVTQSTPITVCHFIALQNLQLKLLLT